MSNHTTVMISVGLHKKVKNLAQLLTQLGVKSKIPLSPTTHMSLAGAIDIAVDRCLKEIREGMGNG